jgi:capsular polysaccharide biosynthesis protein
MEFSEILAQLRRRWWLVVVGALTTGALAYGATLVVAVQYTAESSVVLIPPRTTADTEVNPFLAIGGLNPAADVLVRALNTGTFHDTHAPDGGPAQYTVSRDTNASGPLLIIDVTDATPDGAMALLDTVVKQVPQTLARLQTDVGVQESAAIHITEVARVAQAKPDRRSQSRALVVALVAGLALTVIAVRGVDAMLIRRTGHRRRAADAGLAEVEGAGTGPEIPEHHPRREAVASTDDARDAAARR